MPVKTKVAIPPWSPIFPARLNSEVVYAVKGLFAGEATAAQQALVAEWLIVEVCRKDDMSYRPGGPEGDRDTAVAEGKRFVALQVLRAYNMPPDKLSEMRDAETAARGPIIEGENELGRRE